MKNTAVCIVNYNTRELLRACIYSALAEHPNEIIVVDNASTDGSAEMVQTEFPSVKLLRLDKNIGYGAASNRAVEHSYGDYILLLNSDTVIKPGALRSLTRYFESHKFAVMLGPRISNPDGTPQTSCFHFPTPLHIFLYLSGFYRWIPRVPLLKKRSLQAYSANAVTVVPWVLGAALAFRRLTFEAMGGFDESFFMYFEEVDLCQRLSHKGQQIHFVPDVEIVHVGGASTEQQRARMNLEYFASLAKYYRKHYSKLFLVELVLMVKFFAFIRLARDFFLLQATRDAARRSTLKTNLTVHQGLLFSGWNSRSIVPV